MTGPFTPYAPPGAYAQTTNEPLLASLSAGLRIPAIIAVGQEDLEQVNLEMVRGSSSVVDTKAVAEDITGRWVVDATNPLNPVLGVSTGIQTKFRVRNFPIVTGDGSGTTTNETSKVAVFVNDVPVSVGAVNGLTGEVTLQVPPSAGASVKVTYFWHRGDTQFVDNLSDQVSSSAAELVAPASENYVVVSNVNDIFRFKVEGVAYSVTFAPGATTAASLKTQLDAALIPNLTTSVFTAPSGSLHLKLSALQSLEIGTGTANGILGFLVGQKTNRVQSFRVYQRPIVDGSSAGLTTTDPSKVVVKVNSVQVVPTALDGTNGLVTLPFAPAAGSTVEVTYWANTWQDTFDELPNTFVSSVTRAGIGPDRSDYIQGQDFVVVNDEVSSKVAWGAAVSTTSGLSTPNAAVLGSSQIMPSLVDDRMYNDTCTRFVDTSVIPSRVSDRVFLLSEVPTAGNGRDTPLSTSVFSSLTNNRQDLAMNRPDLLVVHTGRTLSDALGRSAVKVVEVDGLSRKITLKDPVPPDHNAYATYWYNRLGDDTFTVTCLTPGPLGVGQYSVHSSSLGVDLMQVKFGTKGGGLSETVQWPRGVEAIPDAMHVGGTPVPETVTVTFSSSPATNAVYTNKGAGPWDLYSTASATWRTVLNGGSTLSTNLATATRGYMVSAPVALSGGNLATTIVASSNDTWNFTVDGVDLSVTIPAGTPTPAAVATAVNAVIDAHPTFTGTAPNNLFAPIAGPGANKTFFVLRSYSVPGALPGGFDHASYVAIRQGTAESVLGFTTFARVDGTTGAINKAATCVSANAQAYSFVAGVNDTFKVRINGVVLSGTISPASTTAANVVSDINAFISSQGTASVGTLANLNKVRITSNTNSATTSIEILDGTANETLGFVEGDVFSQTRVDPQEVANRLMDTANFAVSAWPTPYATGGVAYGVTVDNLRYLTIQSVTAGATSSIAFVGGTNSAFNVASGTKITPGVDGDAGEAASDMFTVSSTNPLGSAGTGVPGKTYTDTRSGLRFSVLPAQDGSYTASGNFTLLVSSTFKVDSGVPTYAMPGLETLVTDMVNVGVNDTASVQTFDSSGVEPKNGDIYFITYLYKKVNYAPALYRQYKTIEAEFGEASATNRATLGASISIQNGSPLVMIKQVTKVPNTNQASSVSFITALNELRSPLPGNVKPDVIIPMSTDTAVYSSLINHVVTSSTMREAKERMGFIGFASGTEPGDAATVAKAINTDRIVALYPDSGVVTLLNELGQESESLVDGTFYAAALGGAVCSPAIDVATPYTRRRLQGFKRVVRIVDDTLKNQLTLSGLTVLDDLDTVIRVRQGVTTDMSSALTRIPTVIQIKDYTQQNTRISLDPYIGQKYLASRTNDVEVTLTNMFLQEKDAEIISTFAGIAAGAHPSDPTTINTVGYYVPIFPLEYIVSSYSLRTRLD